MGFEPTTLRVMTPMTLARQRVLSSSEVRASDQNTEGGGFESHLGLRFFCVLLWSILYISRYFLYNTNISGIGWLVRGSFSKKIELEIPKKNPNFT